MKLSKAFILTIVLCTAAIVSAAHADPTIVLIDDKIDAQVDISVDGSVGPANWNESYAGPAYLGTLFQGADIEIYANAPDEQFMGVSRFNTTAPGKFRGRTLVGLTGMGGTGAGIEWAGKTGIKVNWVFRVTGGDTSVWLFAEDWSFDGAVGLKLVDLTAGVVLASITPASFDAGDATVTLLDSHVYRVSAYAWARDFGNGDPDNSFQIEFDTSNIVAVEP